LELQRVLCTHVRANDTEKLICSRKEVPRWKKEGLNSLRRVALATGTPAQSVNSISSGASNDSPSRKGVSLSGVGFLLLDSSLNPVSFNAEAIQILGYPDTPETVGSRDLRLARMIRATLLNRQRSGEPPFVSEFRSGRRHYFCRTFRLDSDAQGMLLPSTAVLLERGPSRFVSLSKVSRRFKLTQREQEVLEYLMKGLESKAIANRMSISPNTVKAFLRLIMIKIGVSSRSAAVVKIVMSHW